MSNRARKLAALGFCIVVGGICFVAGTRQLSGGNQGMGVALMFVSGFFLLSAVGLVTPARKRHGRPPVH